MTITATPGLHQILAALRLLAEVGSELMRAGSDFLRGGDRLMNGGDCSAEQRLAVCSHRVVLLQAYGKGSHGLGTVARDQHSRPLP